MMEQGGAAASTEPRRRVKLAFQDRCTLCWQRSVRDSEADWPDEARAGDTGLVNPHGPLHPWEGTGYCVGVTRSGLPCSNREIQGTGWCLHHVPDELLELAEQIRGGARRCRHGSGCRQ